MTSHMQAQRGASISPGKSPVASGQSPLCSCSKRCPECLGWGCPLLAFGSRAWSRGPQTV